MITKQIANDSYVLLSSSEYGLTMFFAVAIGIFVGYFTFYLLFQAEKTKKLRAKYISGLGDKERKKYESFLKEAKRMP